LSFIPQDKLKSVLSLELKTFEITQALDDLTNPTKFDTWTTYESFFKTIVIRNFNPIDTLQYRVTPNAGFDVIPPLSERSISGWGSFIEVAHEALSSFKGIMVFTMVKGVDAFVK